MNSLGVIIQARLGSTRFPEKILQPFMGSNILLYLIEKLNKLDIPVIVATTRSELDDKLYEYLTKLNIKVFRGDENDVLQRYISASKHFGFTEIIRICADSPFVDIGLLKELIDVWDDAVDYCSYEYDNKPTVLSHFGIFGEIVKVSALERVHSELGSDFNKEHVTYGVYSNPQRFSLKLVKITDLLSKYEGIRLTVDTVEDYENITTISNDLGNLNDLSFTEIGDWLLLNKPDMIIKMNDIISKNKK